MCELEAELDSDHSCWEHVQANAQALQAELDGLRPYEGQQAKQAQQRLTRAEKKVWASKRRFGKMKEKHKELHEAKTHLNSLHLSSQAAEQRRVTAQGQVMVFALTIVAVCLAFVYRGWWSMVASVHA